MLNETDFINEEYNYSFNSQKGKEYSLAEIVNNVYTYFRNQNRTIEKEILLTI